MINRIGYFVRCIDPDHPRFFLDECLEVTSVSADCNKVLLGFDNNRTMWDADKFEEITVHQTYSNDSVTVYEAPEPTIEITRKEYLALLDAEMWWHSALLGNVRDFCGWPDIMEHYLALKKEEKENINGN